VPTRGFDRAPHVKDVSFGRASSGVRFQSCVARVCNSWDYWTGVTIASGLVLCGCRTLRASFSSGGILPDTVGMAGRLISSRIYAPPAIIRGDVMLCHGRLVLVGLDGAPIDSLC
jgi:hypothetical protein